MALKEILLHLNGLDTRASKLTVAVQLARRHGAHITGLYLVAQRVIPAYAASRIPPEVFENQERDINAAAAGAEGEFRAAVENGGVNGEWRFLRGFTDRELIRQARYADLLVMSQAEDAGLASADAAVDHHVVIGCGRPVLFVPRSGFGLAAGGGADVGKQVLLAWNGSNEAARAARDALPLLELAERVDVVAVNPPAAAGEIATADLCRYLSRHGVKAEGSQIDTDRSVGDSLLARAADLKSDLVVTGAYGHSRLFETVLGGVTERLLKKMTVPVLMSH